MGLRTGQEKQVGADLVAVPESTSESEEMFLITVARAIEDGHSGPVPVPLLAEGLSISRVSANDTAKKLVARGFIEYEPYHGVTLTAGGTAIANRVLRRRRLWALFLAEHLGLTAAAADTVACEFEHITPAEVASRLADFLGDPTVDPGGKPIPAAGSTSDTAPSELTLADLEVGRRARVTRVAGDQAVRSFLLDEGIIDGVEVTLLAVGADHGCLVDTPRGHVHMSAQIALNVIVSAISRR
jgi:DtxR family transcriptional regulator, Mn-dependent transcriptional regulator